MTLFKRWFRQVCHLLQSTPLYHFYLMGKPSSTLITIPLDLWPGEARRGRLLLDGKIRIRDKIIDLAELWNPPDLDPLFLKDLHAFGWLRDLHAIGDNASRRLARQLILSWIENHSDWRSPAWRPGILGHRLANWLSLYEFFCASADDQFRAIFYKSLHRQSRHLVLSWEDGDTALDRFEALKGLIYTCVCIQGNLEALPNLLNALEDDLAQQLLTDGVHVSKDPEIQLKVLLDLIDLRTLLRNTLQPLTKFLQTTIYRMAPVVRLFRHGDGGLATFGKNSGVYPALVDVVLSLADARGKPPERLMIGGFERCSSREGVLLFKMGEACVGATPDTGTGLFIFEWSAARERLITRGDVLLERPDLLSPLFTSEMTSLDLQVERHTKHGNVLIDMTAKDTFQTAFDHNRQVYITEDHTDLRGEDHLMVTQDMGFAIRFVLSDQIDSVSITPDGRSALLHTKAGQSWRMLTSGAEPILCEPSPEIPTPTLCLFGHATAHQRQVIKWAFRRD